MISDSWRACPKGIERLTVEPAPGLHWISGEEPRHCNTRNSEDLICWILGISREIYLTLSSYQISINANPFSGFCYPLQGWILWDYSFTSISMKIALQPFQHGSSLPYPFFIDETGAVWRQDFWKWSPKKLLWFSEKPITWTMELSFEDFWETPKKCLNMFPVFLNEPDDWVTHKNHIDDITIIPDSETVRAARKKPSTISPSPIWK